MVVHVIRLIFLSSPNVKLSLHPAMFYEMTIMIAIVTLDEKPILISTWSDSIMSSAMNGFVTIVVTLVAVTMEPYRISLSSNLS